MRAITTTCLSAFSLALSIPTADAAEPFAATGTRATLSVEYVYESAGQQRSAGQYDPYAWQVKRSAQLSAALSSLAPQALPMLHQVESAQTAAIQAKGQKAQTLAAGMAPTIDAAMKVAEKCGDDEACFMRESQKAIGAMHGNGQMAVLKQTQRDAAPLMKLDAPRYQYWAATTQTGRFQTDESVQVSVTDPICTTRPRHRCTRSEVRQGAGDLPAALPGLKPGAQANASVAAVEVDSVKGTLALRLPVVGMLPYTETITTDEPEGTHDTPTPKGPQPKLMRFRTTADDAITMDKPLIVPLAGGWRSQSGVQVVTLKGAFGNAGKLTVRWRLAAS